MTQKDKSEFDEESFLDDPDTAAEEAEAEERTTLVGDTEAEIKDAAFAVLEKLQDENEDLKDKLLRAAAETENIRRQMQREVTKARTFGGERMARDLLSVADNLRRALDSLPEDVREAAKDFIVGVEMTESELLIAFEKNGVTRVGEPGDPFDPAKHQAVAQVPSPDHPKGTIIDVVQPGYVMSDRSLRPAMTVVSAGASTENDSES